VESLAPGPLLAAPLSRRAGASPTSLAQCVLHTPCPWCLSTGTEFVSNLRQESNATYHLIYSTKEGDDARRQ